MKLVQKSPFWFGYAPEGIEAPKGFAFISLIDHWLRAKRLSDGAVFYVKFSTDDGPLRIVKLGRLDGDHQEITIP